MDSLFRESFITSNEEMYGCPNSLEEAINIIDISIVEKEKEKKKKKLTKKS